MSNTNSFVLFVFCLIACIGLQFIFPIWTVLSEMPSLKWNMFTQRQQIWWKWLQTKRFLILHFFCVLGGCIVWDKWQPLTNKHIFSIGQGCIRSYWHTLDIWCHWTSQRLHSETSHVQPIIRWMGSDQSLIGMKNQKRKPSSDSTKQNTAKLNKKSGLGI